MAKSIKLKPCEHCQTLSKIRYRIQYDDNNQWYLVCSQCWEILSKNNPNYRYGGTWKAK
jgi:hypothetical protein